MKRLWRHRLYLSQAIGLCTELLSGPDAARVRETIDKAINQCDGCRRGLPLRDGIHRGTSLYDMIGCTADRYTK